MKRSNVRWTVVALIFFATTINYIDRQVIGLLKPYIQDDLGWSEADYGYIVTAFQVAYGIGMLVCGRLWCRTCHFGIRRGRQLPRRREGDSRVVSQTRPCLRHWPL